MKDNIIKILGVFFIGLAAGLYIGNILRARSKYHKEYITRKAVEKTMHQRSRNKNH